MYTTLIRDNIIFSSGPAFKRLTFFTLHNSSQIFSGKTHVRTQNHQLIFVAAPPPDISYLVGVKMGWYWSIFCEILSLLLYCLKVTFQCAIDLILPPKDANLSGEVAIVTGAGHGIGRELALQLSQEGVQVVCWDINEASVRETQKMIEEQNGTAWAFKCDVSNRDEVISVSAKTR